ncbi:hypothetical protein GQ53DRAFT_755290 [Thozetella sp. PMI_491]|nr:hypothetical protein GQ53DRAFT_755290 [Thozetella sp. PMI_491]
MPPEGIGEIHQRNEFASQSTLEQVQTHSSLGFKDIAVIVWPSFFAFQSGEPEHLQRGFVLNRVQVNAAWNEINAQRGIETRREGWMIARRRRQRLRLLLP